MHVESFRMHSAGDDHPEVMEITLSSEEPVTRYGWFEDPWVEILGHDEGEIDLSRFEDPGIALLIDHQTGDQIGILNSPRTGKDGKLRGDARFSSRARAQEYRTDMEDGIRPWISIGYRIGELKLVKEVDGAPDEYRATRWAPLEGSSVAVPADNTVGVGRSLGGVRSGSPEAPCKVYREVLPDEETKGDNETRSEDPPNSDDQGREAQKEVQTMDTDAAVADAASREALKVEVTDNIRNQAAEISKMCEAYGCSERASEFIAQGLNPDQVSTEILKSRDYKQIDPDTHVRQEVIDLTAREARQYSISKAILNMVDGRHEGLEFEVSEHIAKKLGSSPTSGRKIGLYIPTSLDSLSTVDIPARLHEMHGKRILTAGTATDGAELVFEEEGAFIDMLRNRMFTVAMGARVLSGLQGNIAFPRQTSSGTLSWEGENPGSDVAESMLQLDQLQMSPKTAMSTTSFARQLLAQSVIGVEALVREDLQQIGALGLDLASLIGPGTGNEALGVLATPGIGDVAGGTNGATPTWGNIVDLETAVAVGNADVGSLGYMTTPGIRGYCKQTLKNAGVAGHIWEGTELNGYQARATSQVPSNLTKGTAIGIAHAIIFGNWADLFIGEWGAMEIIVDPYSAKKRGNIEVTLHMMADVGVRHAVSFAAMQDALTS